MIYVLQELKLNFKRLKSGDFDNQKLMQFFEKK